MGQRNTRRRPWWPAVAPVLAALVLGACGPQTPAPPRPVSTGRPIFNGVPDTSQEHLATVALTFGPGTSYFCSGTLVSRKVVLTAGHCLHNVTAIAVEVFFGQDVEGAGVYRVGAQKEIHPDYNNGQLRDDLALLRLAVNAPSTVTPIPPLPTSQSLTDLDLGISLDFSGFGLTELSTDGVKLHIAMPLALVCDGPFSCDYNGAPVNPRTFAYSMAPGGPCSGDSGGPAYVWRGGVEYVAGVTSYGDGPCLDYGVSAKVDRYQTWIDDFVAAVPEEDCVAAGDEDGDGDADCADPDCALDPACQGPDACTAAATIGCGDTVSDTTAGGATVFQTYGCLSQGTEDGAERAFLLDVPAGVDATVVMTPDATGGDLDLFLLPASLDGCDPAGCLAGSLETGTAPESLTFTMPAAGAYLVVDTYAGAPGGFALGVTCGATPEVCTNGVDDDGDGDVDCDDADCDGVPFCQPGPDAAVDDDAGADGDAAVAPGDGSADASPTPGQPDPGCGCGTSSTGGHGPLALLLALSLLACLRRRRVG